MFESLLPGYAVAVEAWGEEPPDAPLLPRERQAVADAVASRRREFAAVRMCARAAMRQLGTPPAAVVPDRRGAPQWPPGLVGSMTHCHGFRAAALARTAHAASLGIDAEPHAPLRQALLPSIALPEEADQLRALGRQADRVRWDTVLFSAKESVYKAWYPLTARWLDFLDAAVTLAPAHSQAVHGTFTARILTPPTPAPARFSGQWRVQRGVVATAVWVAHRVGTAP